MEDQIIALRKAALEIDQETAASGYPSTAEAGDLWLGLVSGSWSLVDQFDTEGHRYYVAHRDPSGEPVSKALSVRERQVWYYAAQGYADKQIAFKLGVSKSTVAAYVASLKRKLGVSTRTDLVRLGAGRSY